VRSGDVFSLLVPVDRGIGLRAYDGARVNDDADVVLELTSPRGAAYLAGAPGQLGLARAYVAGDLVVHGDLDELLRRLLPLPGLTVADRARLVRWALPYAARRPAPPAVERVRGRGRRHSHGRDAAAVAHHYDVGNEFYALMLGPSMTYSCAVFAKPDLPLEQAQQDKHDLVCRKLGLSAGTRVLDVGCGWGAFARHAAGQYGARVLGVTLSREQAAWAQQAVAGDGLSSLVEIRLSDYRAVPERGFDAVCSVGMMEHVGRANYPEYFRRLAAALRPQGRLLNHTITRSDEQQPRPGRATFVDRYVFPDGELSGAGHILGRMNEAGFEIRHDESLREHYVLTLRQWGRNLDREWDRAAALAGTQRARVWRLYVAATRLAFERHEVEVHQMLGALPGPDGVSGLPLRPDWA
jgi:cyclopropane-fatty-acyl-phospholipid synthase